MVAKVEGGSIAFAPPVGDDYWTYRVRVGDGQAIVGFPKFSTIGIGFAVEEDWNTNLPWTVPTDRLWEHIRDNKGDDRIPDQRCIDAIRLIQEAAAADRPEVDRAALAATHRETAALVDDLVAGRHEVPE